MFEGFLYKPGLGFGLVEPSYCFFSEEVAKSKLHTGEGPSRQEVEAVGPLSKLVSPLFSHVQGLRPYGYTW